MQDFFRDSYVYLSLKTVHFEKERRRENEICNIVLKFVCL
jgi:hypothetical protein